MMKQIARRIERLERLSREAEERAINSVLRPSAARLALSERVRDPVSLLDLLSGTRIGACSSKFFSPSPRTGVPQ